MEEIDKVKLRNDVQLADAQLLRMGHDIARRVGLTMLGRASGRHYLAFTGRHRLVLATPQPTAIA